MSEITATTKYEWRKPDGKPTIGQLLNVLNDLRKNGVPEDTVVYVRAGDGGVRDGRFFTLVVTWPDDKVR